MIQLQATHPEIPHSTPSQRTPLERGGRDEALPTADFKRTLTSEKNTPSRQPTPKDAPSAESSERTGGERSAGDEAGNEPRATTRESSETSRPRDQRQADEHGPASDSGESSDDRATRDSTADAQNMPVAPAPAGRIRPVQQTTRTNATVAASSRDNAANASISNHAMPVHAARTSTARGGEGSTRRSSGAVRVTLNAAHQTGESAQAAVATVENGQPARKATPSATHAPQHAARQTQLDAQLVGAESGSEKQSSSSRGESSTRQSQTARFASLHATAAGSGADGSAPAALRAAVVESALQLHQLATTSGQATSSAQLVASLANPTALTPGTTAIDSAAPLGQATASSAAPAPQDLNLISTNRIIRGVHAMLNHQGGAMTMRLDPPELGELRIQMTVHRGAVNATLHIMQPEAHDLISRNLGSLRSALESQGLQVERLHVAGPPSAQAGESSLRHDSDSRQASQRHEHDASDGQSRGRRGRDDQQEQRGSWLDEFLARGPQQNSSTDRTTEQTT